MTAGTLVSKPTTSSMPRSFGSARVKPLEVMPTTTALVLLAKDREGQKLSAFLGETFQFTCRPSAKKNWMDVTNELLTRRMIGRNPRPSQVA